MTKHQGSYIFLKKKTVDDNIKRKTSDDIHSSDIKLKQFPFFSNAFPRCTPIFSVPPFMVLLLDEFLKRTVVNYNFFKWLQQDSNPQPLSSEMNTQPFSQTGQMIELCRENSSVWCIRLYVISEFTVIVARMSRNSFLQTRAISEVQVNTTIFASLGILASLAKWLWV